MILVGNQRGGARDMALHLMKPDNDHIDVHEIRGFVSDTVMGALNESYAMSKATKCSRHLYSLSANPPPDKQVSTEDFVKIFDRVEKELNLVGQSRVVVFHEKQGRRHAHCVWTRINPSQLKAMQLSHDHPKLVRLSREIFIERGWEKDMPAGLIDRENRDPLNYSLAEYQQAKRAHRKPEDIKADFQSAWAISDSLPAFKHALREKGYWLAQGDSRGYVALDHNLKPYSVSRWTGAKRKKTFEKLGDIPDKFPTIADVSDEIRRELGDKIERLREQVATRAAAAQERFEVKRQAIIKKQSAERTALRAMQERNWLAASRIRQDRFTRGLSGVWDRLRGEHKRIREQNEREAYNQAKADQKTRDALIWQHLQERQRIEIFKSRHRDRAVKVKRSLEQDHKQLMKLHAKARPVRKRRRSREVARSLEPEP